MGQTVVERKLDAGGWESKDANIVMIRKVGEQTAPREPPWEKLTLRTLGSRDRVDVRPFRVRNGVEERRMWMH